MRIKNVGLHVLITAQFLITIKMNKNNELYWILLLFNPEGWRKLHFRNINVFYSCYKLFENIVSM